MRYSGHLTGWFDFLGDQITGWAENIREPARGRLTIFVVRGSRIITSAPVKEKSEAVGWRFVIETGSLVTGDDILHERVRVLVRDAAGGMSWLRLEGSTQLQLIREFMDDPAVPFLEVDFKAGGNSSAFVRDGWSGQEATHRWAVGKESSMEVPAPLDDRSYELRLLVWPFVVPGKLTSNACRCWLTISRSATLALRTRPSCVARCPRARWRGCRS